MGMEWPRRYITGRGRGGGLAGGWERGQSMREVEGAARGAGAQRTAAANLASSLSIWAYWGASVKPSSRAYTATHTPRRRTLVPYQHTAAQEGAGTHGGSRGQWRRQTT